MAKLPLHPETSRRVEQLLTRPPQALLLSGPAGSGKVALAEYMCEQLLAVDTGKLAGYAYLLQIEPTHTIGIAAVRQLRQFLSLTVPRRHSPNRAVIIQQAETLTPEAQNALLKTLEEPPAGSLLILLADWPQALLPTVLSRLQTIRVLPPDEATLLAHFEEQGFGSADIQRVQAISGGLPGLMQAILSDNQHPLRAAAEQARNLLQGSTYDRLCHVDSLAKQRDLTRDVLLMLQQMARLSLQRADGPAAIRWRSILQAAYEAQERLAANVQPKLVLTSLMPRL